MKNLSCLLLSAFLTLGNVVGAQAAGNSSTAAATTQTVTLAVQNMDCPLCPFTVRKALENVPGVSKVSVDFYGKTATVAFDPSKTNAQALTQATSNAGFPSTVKK